MKRAFLLMVAPALLVALGFAQTPAASTNSDQADIKGCLAGADGNYTVVEDNTGHIFKVTTSSVDLKAHLGHDVALTGHRASGGSSAPADNSFAVTELHMISEHCAAPAAAPAATVSTPSETAIPPPAATPPAETVVAPAVDAAAPAATVSTPSETAIPPTATTPPAETVVAPAVDASAPAATVSTPAEIAIPPTAATAPVEIAVAPAATAAQAKPRSAHSRKLSATAAATTAPAGATSTALEPASQPAAAAVTPVATDSSSSEPVSTPSPAATMPTASSRGWSLWLGFGVLLVAIGVMFPFFSRWRKRKNLERTGTPNLSFTHEASAEQDEGDEPVTRKAA